MASRGWAMRLRMESWELGLVKKKSGRLSEAEGYLEVRAVFESLKLAVSLTT